MVDDRATPLLRMSRISKAFGPTRALRGVSLEVRRGQVLALIGENGAGKSTLMKILSGAHQPDAGSMYLEGTGYAPRGPHEARLAGVAMIYQELNLAPDLSVEDNVMLGQESHWLGILKRGSQRQQVQQALRTLGHADLDPRARVSDLSIGEKQLVEIARALVLQARVIVLDEPTSSLARDDVQRLFDVVRTLREAGLGIVYISHFLEEVRQVCDDYQVLRDGENAGAGRLADASDYEIVSKMVGRSVEQLFPRVPHEIGEPVLRLSGLSGRKMPSDVDLEVRRGEILGVAGLVGAGRTEMLRCLFGLDRVRRGEVRIGGRHVRLAPRARIRAGLGLVAEDRKLEGLAQQRSISDNVTLSRLAPYSRLGWLALGRRRRAVAAWLDRLSVKTRGPEQTVEDLSGGNQQKVALARILHQDADILLLDEPTRGIDVGTKSEIYRLMGELAAEGRAILFVSSYLPELLAICDRVAVMSRGRLTAVRPAAQWTEESIMAAAIAGDARGS
jgi:ribose transport system ATP-binding protein